MGQFWGRDVSSGGNGKKGMSQVNAGFPEENSKDEELKHEIPWTQMWYVSEEQREDVGWMT